MSRQKFSGIQRGQVAAKAAAADIALGVDRATADSKPKSPPARQQASTAKGGRPRLEPGRRHVKISITLPGAELGRLDALVERQKSRGSRADHAGMVIRCGLEALSKMSDEEIQQLAADLATR